MRKITLLTFVLFIGLATSQAQMKVSPGIRGGLNLSTLTNIDDNSMKSDYYIGGLVEIKFNKYFTLQPEITYTRQGAEVREFEIDGPGSRTSNYNLNYISLGAVAKFHFGGGGFHILGGPSLDIKTDDNFPAFDYNPVGTDVSIVGGIGYSLPNGLSFEARFKQGLIDIYGYEGIDEDYYYDDIILNTVFQIGISYTFQTK